MTKKVIGICGGRSCCRTNQKLWDEARQSENENVVFEEAMCLGLCEDGPNIRVDDEGKREKVSGVTRERLREEVE